MPSYFELEDHGRSDAVSSGQARRRPLTNVEFLMLRSLLRHQGWCTHHPPLWRFRAGRWDELSAWELDGPQGRGTWRKVTPEILPQRDKFERMELANEACLALQKFGYVAEGPAGCCDRHRLYRLTERGRNFIERVDRAKKPTALLLASRAGWVNNLLTHAKVWLERVGRANTQQKPATSNASFN